jgi:hypothetical protein
MLFVFGPCDTESWTPSWQSTLRRFRGRLIGKITSAKGAEHELDVLSDSTKSVQAVAWDSSSYGLAGQRTGEPLLNRIQLSPEKIESDEKRSSRRPGRRALPHLRSQALVTSEEWEILVG